MNFTLCRLASVLGLPVGTADGAASPGVHTRILLLNGAKASNVFWQVGSSATLGTTSAFQGTIMADQSITLNTGASLTGRALARIGAVTLDGNAAVLPTP